MSEELVKPSKKKSKKPLTDEETDAKRQLQKIHNKTYQEAHKEEIKAQRAEYRKAHKAELAAKNKEYKERNKEQLAAKRKAWREANRDKILERGKKFWEENRERLLIERREYRQNNREKLNKKSRESQRKKPKPVKGSAEHARILKNGATYRIANKEKIKARNKANFEALSPEEKAAKRAKRAAHVRKQRATDESLRMLGRVRNRIFRLLGDAPKTPTGKVGSFIKYFGCTRETLFSHLESLMKEGMTWENHGKVWQIDHIVPLSLGRENHALLLKLNHFKNLRPLSVAENASKGDKVPKVWPEGVPFTREECGLAAP